MNPARALVAATGIFVVTALVAAFSVREILLFSHITVFAVWLGTDVATFTLSRRVLDRRASVEVRRALASAMLSIEVIARLSLPTMLGLGLALSVDGGYLDLPRAVIPFILLAAAGWVGLVWAIHTGSGGEESTGQLARFDLGVRSLIAVAMWALAVASLVSSDGPLLGDWLAVKAGLFALVMTCGIAIRFILRPFGPAFARLISEGSTSANEVAMADPIARAQPLVGVIWFSLLAAAILAVTKALPWQ